jgi:hypothetical protein
MRRSKPITVVNKPDPQLVAKALAPLFLDFLVHLRARAEHEADLARFEAEGGRLLVNTDAKPRRRRVRP